MKPRNWWVPDREQAAALAILMVLAILVYLLRTPNADASSSEKVYVSSNNPCRIFGWAYEQKDEYTYPKIHVYVDRTPSKRSYIYGINEADSYPPLVRCY
jgi:hypothetical protein